MPRRHAAKSRMFSYGLNSRQPVNNGQIDVSHHFSLGFFHECPQVTSHGGSFNYFTDSDAGGNRRPNPAWEGAVAVAGYT